jgi:hypothetical protein
MRVGSDHADRFRTNGSYPAVGAEKLPVWNRPPVQSFRR